jgi:hypothetical protein
MPKIKELVSKCPPEVKIIIDSANSLPHSFVITYSNYFPIDLESQTKLFYEIATTLPKEFAENNDWLNRVLRGEKVWDFKKGTMFPPLVELSSTISTAKHSRYGLTFVVRANNRKDDLLTSKLSKYSGLFIREGIIEVFTSYPLNVLINQKIDTRRIKHCRDCKNFFWVKRQNKNVENQLCEKCGGKKRQKEFVNKDKATFNRERRRKRYEKEKTPFCERCVRPNTKCACYLNERRK